MAIDSTESDLLLSINPNSGTPIYRQVCEQISRMVASGQLKAGDALPSVRQIALRFEVNPMTISKAYSLLETEGTLERVRGVGMKVAQRKNLEQNLEERLQLLQPAIDAIAAQIEQLQIPRDEALKAIKQKLEKKS